MKRRDWGTRVHTILRSGAVFGCLLLTCFFLSASNASGGQYDRESIPAELTLSLRAGPYEIVSMEYESLGEILQGDLVTMEGFDFTTSAGNPILPLWVVEVAVPPNAIVEGIDLKVEEVEEYTVEGWHDILPAPPVRARVDDVDYVNWGPGKEIVAGRNEKVYGVDAFYPAEPVAILSVEQMRKWRFLRIGFTPVRYNPVSGTIQVVDFAQIRISYHTDKLNVSDPLLADAVMDDEARSRFVNFAEALEWYQYVPPEQPGPTPWDPDYVIVTTSTIVANSAKLSAFVTHKTSLGHSVLVVTESDYGGLTGPAPNGTAEKIRQWLINNYVPLGIEYVLLIGDPDPDDPAQASDSVGDVPMKMCWPNVRYYMYRESPTDYFYADLTGNWDLDGDGWYGESCGSTGLSSPDTSIGSDSFSARWTGKIRADTAGSHSFVASYDDGFRLVIDGTTVIDAWSAANPPATGYGSIALTAGQHDITVEFREDTRDGMVNLRWRPPTGSYYASIPQGNLYHLSGGTYVPNGLDAHYFDNADFTGASVTRVDPTIDFYWGDDDNGTGGVEWTPEVYVGRVPVYDDTDCSALDSILQKTIDYETGATPAWRRSMLVAVPDMSPGNSDWQLGEALKGDFADLLSFATYRVYEGDFGLTPLPECPAINAKNASATAPCNMLGEWANGGGHGVVAWGTHGWPTGASDLIVSSDATHLDDTTPAFVFQASCLNGYPESDNNLGYALLEQGAIGTVSASRVSWYAIFTPPYNPNPLSGTNENLTYYYTGRIMQDHSAGRALFVTKANVSPGSSWMNKMDYNLYGDPSVSLLRLYGGVALLFDTSGSMSWRHDGSAPAPLAEQRIEIARQAVYPFLDLLSDFANHRTDFGIAAFPPHPWSASVGCNGQVITPLTLVSDAAVATAKTITVPGLSVSGNTPLLAGVSTAMGMFSTEDRRAVVLLSDGYHNCPSSVTLSDPSVTTLVSQLQAADISVYTIGLGRPTDVDHPLLDHLATATGGAFYDVTGPTFVPATFSPTTALQATYKAILVDALGLETAADPTGILPAGKQEIHSVHINEHDRMVSIYLSWETPIAGRLALSVTTSDGSQIAVGSTGVRQHQGATYEILTVDRSYLRRSGVVGPSPWTITISPTGLDDGEIEPFQYSVIVDSTLDSTFEADRADYCTGDVVTLTFELTEAGQPLTDATVYAWVSAPDDGLGNWYVSHPVDEAELNEAEIPAERGGELFSQLQRTAIYLTDVLRIDHPGRASARRIPLVDDGSNGDAAAYDGIYTARYADVTVSGTYAFHVFATGKTSGGNLFDRDAIMQRHVVVGATAEGSRFTVSRLLDGPSSIARYELVVTPRDAYGNYLGPGYSGIVGFTTSAGDLIGSVQDGLDGTYRQILQLPVDVRPYDVAIDVKAARASWKVNLGQELTGSFPYHSVLWLLYDRLLEFTSEGYLRPGLVESWEVSDDGMTVTLYLRPEVSLHDGSPLDAFVVAHNLCEPVRLITGYERPPLCGTGPISDVRVVDDYVLKIELLRPDPLLLSRLAGIDGIIVVPQNEAGALGSGSFVLRDWQPDKGALLEAFPDYWGARPEVTKLVFRVIHDEETRWTALASGEVDLIVSYATDAEDRARQQGIPVCATQSGYVIAMPHVQELNCWLGPALTLGSIYEPSVIVIGVPQDML